VQWRQIVTFKSVQCHPGLTYIFLFLTFGHAGTLALRAECQSAQMSEIKMQVRPGWQRVFPVSISAL